MLELVEVKYRKRVISKVTKLLNAITLNETANCKPHDE